MGENLSASVREITVCIRWADEPLNTATVQKIVKAGRRLGPSRGNE